MEIDFVDDFLAQYRKQYDFYDQAGRLAAKMLEGSLKDTGIRSIVTSRAKAIEGLKAKVRARAPRKTYASVEDIFEDIVDLAGVRVALYFPGEQTQADRIIQNLFILHRKPKRFPDPSTKAAYEKRFSGYHATHYRVRLKEKDLKDVQKHYAKAKIEIQVASVLMHSWAEVEHDLVYKPQQGELSPDEYAILDELNGMVLEGESGLKRLQEAGEARVAAAGRPFSNYYDLASHLLATSARVVGSSIGDTALGRIDLLFELIKRLDRGTPERLKPYIVAIKPDFEQRPLAEQIIDQLLAENPTRYPLYESLRASRPVPSDYAGKTREEVDLETHEEVSQFLVRWVAFEKKIIEKAKRLGVQGIYASSRLLSRMGVEDETLLKDFERIRRMRNEVVHGLSLPSAENLRDAGGRIEEISNDLEHL